MKRTKRSLALLLAVLMLAASLVFAFAEDAADPAAAESTAAAETTTEAETTSGEATTAADPAKAESTAPAETSATAEEASTTAAQEKPTTEAPTTEAPTTTAPATTAAATGTTGAKSGSCGPTANWKLNTEGVLSITGGGEIDDYQKEKNVPWAGVASQIKTVVIAEGITGVGDRAFSGCTNLQYVSFPSTLKTIGGWAFNGCSALTELRLPDGLTDIDWYAFCDCKLIKEVIFPDSVKTIGASSFSGCNHLANVKLPAALTCIEYYVFQFCHGIKAIVIPNTVKEIGGGAFHNCVQLTEVTVPRSVERIGEFAFMGCNKLQRVTVLNGSCEIPMDDVNEKEPGPENQGRDFPLATVLRSYEGSTLQAFAKKFNRTFEAIPDIPEHDHVWGEPVVTKEATCLQTGVRTYTCSVCGEVKEEEIATTEHNPVVVPSVPATCKKTGLTEGVSCSICGMVFTPQAILPKTGHSWKEKVTKAKIGSNGKVIPTCTVCKTTKTETVAKINSVKLSETKYKADGTAKKPTVTVKDSNNNKLKKDQDYTLKYSSGRKNVGVYTVTVTFKGHYGGTKTLKFKIVPGKVKGLKVKAIGNKKFTLTWDKVTGAKKYAVYYATSENGSYKKLGSFAKTTLTTGGYTPGKTYYFKVRAVTTVDDTNHFGAYSLVKHAKAKW